MKKILVLAFFISFTLQATAYTFTDDFNRASLGTTWLTWIESSGGSSGISNNELFVNNDGEGVESTFVYSNLGASFYDTVLTLSGKLKFSSHNSTSTGFYMGLKATDASISKDLRYWYTYGKGYGVHMYAGGSYYIMDESSASNSGTLQAGSFALTTDGEQEYEFEFVYGENDLLEVRFWTVGSLRPESPSFSYTPQSDLNYSSIASENNLVFGVTDEGTLNIDDLLVTTTVIPEPSSLILFGFCCLGIWVTWKKS